MEHTNGLPDVFKTFDGSGRAPRSLQVEVLQWIAERASLPALAIQAPTGTGKSAIAKAIQRATGGHIIVPSNQLLDQNQATYPQTNFLKGKEHYTCSKHDASCKDVGEVTKPCDDCPYKMARDKAKCGEPTIFNPISKYYLHMGEKEDAPNFSPDVVIVDEAHKLVELLELLVSDDFSKTVYKYPEGLTLSEFPNWVRGVASQMFTLAKYHEADRDMKKAAKATARGLKLKQLAGDVQDYPDNYVLFEETRRDAKLKTDVDYLVLRPVTLPRYILKQVLGDVKQVILLSATLPRYKAEEICGKMPFDYLDVPSPIPAESRAVRMGYKDFTSTSDPKYIAAWIEHRIREFDAKATMVHVTYSMGYQLKKLLPHAIFHANASEKENALQKFKQEGGLWLAAGCSEGVDLPFDECRLNLIPVLPYANAGDAVVKARIAKYGFKWYERQTLITLIQQIGRSTRDPKDFSNTVIGDKRAVTLLKKYKSELSPSFWRSIVW